MKPIILVICLLAFFLLVIRFCSVTAKHISYADGQMVRLTFRLISEPQISDKTQKLSIKLDKQTTIFVTTGLFPQFSYGDVLKITGKVQKRLLRNEQIGYAMFFPKIELQKNAVSRLDRLIGYIRGHIQRAFDRSLSPLQASLLEGIVFGIKQDLPDSFLTNLRNEGLTHIVAASGMNISFVAGALLILFSYLLHRRLALVVSIAGIIFYSLLAGLQPSIVRAMLMAIIAMSASLVGRQNYSLLSLGITGYVMLLYQPESFFDVGFQLSFLATIGIFVVKPYLDQWLFHKSPKLKDNAFYQISLPV